MPLNFDNIVKGDEKEKSIPKEPDDVQTSSEVIPGELTDPIVASQTLWIEEADVKMQAFDLTKVKNYFQKLDVVINGMAEQAMKHKITDKATFDQAIQMGTQARKMQSEIEKRVKELKAPYLAFNRGLGTIAKASNTQLEGIAADLKTRVMKEKPKYMPAPTKNPPKPSPGKKGSAPPPAVKAQNERTKIDGASVKPKVVPKWELEDLSKVPREYLAINPVLVNKAVKAGQRRGIHDRRS
jgi:hypothetical protein